MVVGKVGPSTPPDLGMMFKQDGGGTAANRLVLAVSMLAANLHQIRAYPRTGNWWMANVVAIILTDRSGMDEQPSIPTIVVEVRLV